MSVNDNKKFLKAIQGQSYLAGLEAGLAIVKGNSDKGQMLKALEDLIEKTERLNDR